MRDLPYCITEMRTAMVMNASFFASIMFERGVVEVTDENGMWRGIPCPTAMTDGQHIVFNPSFMEGLSISERIFVGCHEVYHLMAKHPTRFKHYASAGLFGYKFQNPLAQIAADAVINKGLRDSGLGKQPGGINLEKELRDKGYTLTGREAWEDVYKVLLDQQSEEQKKNGGGQGKVQGKGQGPGQGSKGDEPAPGMDGIPEGYKGDVGDTATAQQIPSDAEMKATVNSAAKQAKARGQMPGSLKSLIDDYLEPTIDWREELQSSIMSNGEPDRYDWAHSNRRKIVMPGLIIPRMVSSSCGDVVISIDTSGSVSDQELRAMLGETSAILSDVRPTSLTILWCDSRIDRVDEVEEPEDLLELTRAKGIHGRGGTSFIPPFEYIIKHGLEPAFHIYMTDGYAPFPAESMERCPTIWCITNDSVKAPFGKTIVIDVK